MTPATTESQTLLPEDLQSQLREIEVKLQTLEQRLEIGPVNPAA